MLLSTFYQLITEELENALQENANDKRTATHKDKHQNMGYAMLIWFLQFYGRQPIYHSYITDGKDDSSCDIIFSNEDVEGNTIFYIIQSKYVKYDTTKVNEKSYPNIAKEEFNAVLTDFATLLNGSRKSGKNEAFNEKYKALKTHLEKNGKAKFVFFTLANYNAEIEAAVNSFNKTYSPNITLEIIDIQRIKLDYIEFKYKEVYTSNPLEYQYSPENETIELMIERFDDKKRDIFEFTGRDKAYIFTLKPSTIHKLFHKYKFSLFFKNVRNPLHDSNYNKNIVETLLKQPNAFWYFNNGITAITALPPVIGVHAKKIEIEGLQIINGAQTVYSIYQAYEQASSKERRAMDAYARVTLRLIGSSDETFNLQITRYTNQQNPMLDRDFYANDEIQVRLQNESFNTNLWYEKRRGEFRLSKEKLAELGISIVSNEEMIAAYVAFYLQKPIESVTKRNYFFISHKTDKNGMYEEIFNKNTNYEELFVANLLANLAQVNWREMNDTLKSVTAFLYSVYVAVSKIMLQKYYELIIPIIAGKPFNLSLYLMNIFRSGDENKINEIRMVAVYSFIRVMEILNKKNNGNIGEFMQKMINNPSYYEVLKAEIEEEELDINRIQSIELQNQLHVHFKTKS